MRIDGLDVSLLMKVEPPKAQPPELELDVKLDVNMDVKPVTTGSPAYRVSLSQKSETLSVLSAQTAPEKSSGFFSGGVEMIETDFSRGNAFHLKEGSLENEIYTKTKGKVKSAVSFSYLVGTGIQASISMPGATVEYRAIMRETARLHLEHASESMEEEEAQDFMDIVNEFYNEDVLREMGFRIGEDGVPVPGFQSESSEEATFNEFAKRFGEEGFLDRLKNGETKEGEFLSFIAKLQQNRKAWTEIIREDFDKRSEAIGKQVERMQEMFDAISSFDPDFLDNMSGVFAGFGNSDDFASYHDAISELY